MDGPGPGELGRARAPAPHEPAYVPLWCKSNYSFLEGASRPEELVRTAHELGLPAVAITDRDGVYGMVRAHVAAREIASQSDPRSPRSASARDPRGDPRAAPVTRLIVGSEVTLESGATIVLLAQDRSGYASLCRLVTLGRMRNPKGVSSVTIPEVCEHAEGLLALLARGGEETNLRNAVALRDAFGDRLYGIVARHHRPEDPGREKRITELAAAAGFPLVAATEVLYHTRERRVLQDVLECIRANTALDKAGNLLKPNDEFELKDPQSMRSRYRDVPALLERTLEVASRASFSMDQIRYRYPSESLPKGYTTASWLRNLTLRGACRRYGGSVPAAVRAQLDKELALIEELDYCGYFLTMWEIVKFCRSRGILCQGRGSAANSAVCYCLGITSVDPVRMELLFERFLSRERAEPPDIDLDIEHNRREEAIQHMYEKYGRDHAAMVANFIRYRGRSAVRDVGKALGYPLTVLDRLAKLLSHHDSEIRLAVKEGGADLNLARLERLVALAGEIQDFPRHLSIHPGGFLLGSEPVSDLVPIENATMPERTVIQWDKEDVEDMGLFKVDLLGLGALNQLHFCFDLLKEHLGVTSSMATIPAEDPAVYRMIEASDTVGVFQLESRAQMSMLPRLKPRNFYDIVIEVSIVRPGPITGGMVHPFLRRRNGEEPVVYPHPCLEPVLKKTLGIPLFQEQVMKLAVLAADYSPGEADQLRRDMAAWRKTGRIEGHRERLIGRMVEKGIEAEFAEQVFQQIRGFGEYGFPESHAASFALIAYATAWLKCHYPAVFACALLNAWPMGFYAPATIVEDAKRHGIVFLPVDAMESDWDCTMVARPGGRGEERATLGRREARQRDTPAATPAVTTADGRYAIRMGLRWIKGLGEADYERITAAREQNRPASLAEFVGRATLSRDVLEALAQAGAFRCFGLPRRSALWSGAGAEIRLEAAATADAGAESRLDAELDNAEELPEFPELTEVEAISWDHEVTSHSTTAHALEPYREALRSMKLPEARELLEREEGERVSFAGLVICRQRPETAKGAVFVTLEDESGFVNLVVWRDVFERHRILVLTTSFLGVTGKLQKNGSTVYIAAQTFWRPRLELHPQSTKSRDFH